MLFPVSGFLFAQESLDFEDDKLKFSKVDEGDPVHLTFRFTNEGSQPVVINEAKVGCPCTEVVFPQKPIRPDASDSVVVTFDTRGKIGYQERKIILKTNHGESTLTFKGVVKATEKTKERYKSKNN